MDYNLNSRNDFSREINELKNDIDKWTDKGTDLLKDGVDEAQDQVQNTACRMKEGGRKVMDKLACHSRKVNDAAKNNPVNFAAFLFGVGALMSTIKALKGKQKIAGM